MRPIKFRAWDGKTMVNSYCELDEDNFFIGHDDMDTMQIDSVMQYTGMNDKLDNEIYEGDIVKINSGTNDNFIVQWGSYCWVLKSCTTNKQIVNTSYMLFAEGEVIGNIHNNPELLLTK